MTRLERLQKSFYENGGDKLKEDARIIWDRRSEKLGELEFENCFAQYCEDTEYIDVNLGLSSGAEYQIEMPTKKPNSDWTPKVEEVIYSIWSGGTCFYTGVLNFDELVIKIKEEIERENQY